MKTNKYNNCVIRYDGRNRQEIKEFWLKQGFNTIGFNFNNYGYFYGLCDNKFGSFTNNSVDKLGLKVIILPIKNIYNNCVIKHDGTNGESIREFWKSQGIDTYGYGFDRKYEFYGLKDNCFHCFYTHEIEKLGLKVITLPTINDYPKVMEVSNDINFICSKIRVVEFEKKNRFYAWRRAATLEDAENETGISGWKFAREIQPAKRTLTIDEIAKLAGCGVEDIEFIDFKDYKLVKR